ncbi:ecto-ADP-ribosyltransferase 5-like [Periophthalmus magnuspinnatus]|uniref:ecto-ADP-ribosyltransferase 5-like n=1 Tax=Periophthalmus magnuspinnatus TaxID=409849 RepID=UPI00243657CA|nr:ecto-ADP-ribosyltransferase 5-like [Periophthalmus magnuspinnatus]
MHLYVIFITDRETTMFAFGICLFLSIAAAQGATYELSLMEDSIDDMFSGCTMKTADKIIGVYHPREIQEKPFGDAWNTADSCAKNMLEKMQSKYKELTINHTRAICAYTKAEPVLDKPLNAALQQASSSYTTPTFQFHTVYFWLTSAIQILKKSCETTYRRSHDIFNGKLNQVIRFGHFASSSRDPNLKLFGTKTCFHIKTCLGAFIGEYSDFKGEREVLIPSYEKFKIVDILSGTDQNPVSYGDMKDCSKIFVLKNVGDRTKLNCKVANHNPQIRASIPLIVGFQLIIGFIWKCFSNTAI